MKRPAALTCTLPALAAWLLSAIPLAGQTTFNTFALDTRFTAADLNQFGSGSGTVVDFRGFFGPSWNISSPTIGGYTTGLFGEEYGFSLQASTSGRVGFDVGLKAKGGLLDVDLPNRISIAVPQNVSQPTLTITQDRSAIGSGNFFTTTFPQIELDVGARIQLEAEINAHVAYGFGSAGGTIRLSDIGNTIGGLTQNPLLENGLNPFNNALNILQFNKNGNGELQMLFLPPKDLVGTTGLTIPISSTDVVKFKNSPLKTTLGVVTINPPNYGVSSGAQLTNVSGGQNVILALGLDIPGLITSSFGSPINPLEARIGIPNTPLELMATLLSVDSNVGFGLRQQLDLMPNTVLGLRSNLPVSYQWVANGVTRTYTGLDLLLPMDNSGAASSLTITSMPTEAGWQLFPRIMIDPYLRNRVYLTMTGYLDVVAGQLSVGAFGIGGGTPALYDHLFDLATLPEILLFDTTFALDAPELRRVHRFITPIFSSGPLALTIEPEEYVLFQNRDGIFNASSIQGSLSLANALFINEGALLLSGSLTLSGSSVARLPALDLTGTARVQVEGGSEIQVTGDAPGFVDATGRLDDGTFVLQGPISYTGPDITHIGPDTDVTLVEAANESGPRFNNNGLDGLRTLAVIDGSLTIVGELRPSDPDLALEQSLAVNGDLTLLAGAAVTVAGDVSQGSGGSMKLGDNTRLLATGAFTNVDGAGLLSNVDLTIGGDNLGAIFSHTGLGVTQLAAGSQLTLSGSRPAAGYLQDSGSDGLVGLHTTAGALTLRRGATQSLAGSLTNSGSLSVRDSLSHLQVAGDYTDSGQTTLTDGGALTVGGTLGNLQPEGGLRTLGGVNWHLAGTLFYNGDTIQAVGSDSVLTMLGVGQGLVRQAGNAFADLSLIAGDVTVGGGLSLASNSGLNVTGSLTVDGAGTQVSFRGLTGATGRIEVRNGTLDTTGGAAHAAWWAANPTLSSLPVNGAGQLDFPQAFTMNGTLVYAGPLLTGIAAGREVTVNSPAATPLQTPGGGNGFAAVTAIDGTLRTTGSLRTDASLTVGATGTLDVGAGGTFRVAGSDFTLTPGAQTRFAGALAFGGGPGVATFNLPDGFTFGDAGQILLGSPVAGGNYYTNSGTGGRLLALPGTHWTNLDHRITGLGEITGGTFTNRGLIEAGGGTLTLTGFDGPIVNTGTLRSFGTAAHPARLALTGITLLNSGTVEGNPVAGQLEANSTVALNQSTVTGGGVTVGRDGTLEVSGSTLTLDAFALDGRLLVQDGPGSTINSAMTVRPTGLIELVTGATPASLAFGAGSSLTNQGTISYGTGTDITGVTILNQGRVVLGPGVATNLSNIQNTIAGTIALGHQSTLTLTSSFANSGLVHLSGEDPAVLANSSSTILLGGDVTLSGGGKIQFGGFNTTTTAQVWDYGYRQFIDITVPFTQWNNAGSGVIRSNTGDRVLTIADQTLTGRGNLGEGTLAIDNQAGGAIRVEGAGSVLNIATNTGGFRNRGRLDVGTGATMNISGPFLSLQGGVFTEGSYRVGGTLRVPGLAGGSFDTGVDIVFDGAGAQIVNESDAPVSVGNILSTGSFVRLNGSTTFATSAGNPFTNAGYLGAGTGGLQAFTPGNITITGGHFTNFANGTLTGGRYEVAGTLQFDGAAITTNAAHLTLRADGRVQDELGQDALASLAANTGTLALRSRADFTVGAGVGTFAQRGTVRVDNDSTFDFGSAAVANVAADTPDYWVAGTLTGGTGFNTTGTWLTLYGSQALWTTGGTNSASRRNDGRLTFAGGYGATYSGLLTFQNNGLWEIGSAAVSGVEGNLIRSGASVVFDQDVTIANAGTVRYYGGPTDDLTTGSFRLTPGTHLAIAEPGPHTGRFEANGTIALGAGAALDVQGTFSVGAGPLAFTGGGALNITGGLEMFHPVNFGSTAFTFTPLAGYPITLDGVILARPGLSLGTANASFISLRNGSALIDANDLSSALKNFTSNSGTIELISSGSQTFAAAFTNSGTLRGNFHFGSSLTSSGTVDALLNVSGNLTNTGSLAGTLNVGGNFLNGLGGSVTASGLVTGDYYNAGTLNDLPLTGTRVGGNIINAGTMTLRPGTFLRPDLVTPAPLTNGGTLHVTGGIYNNLAGPGEFRVIAGSTTQLLGTSTATGRWFVGSGANLTIDGDSRLGAAPTLSVLPWVVVGENARLNLGGALAPYRSVSTAAGSVIAGTSASAAIPGGVTATGDLTLAGLLTTRLSLGSGTLTLDDATLTLSGSTLFAGAVTGSGFIVNPGTYSLAFDGGGTFEGSVVNSAGVLTIGGSAFAANIINDGAANFTGGGALTLGGSLTGSGDLFISNNTAVTLTRGSAQAGGTVIAAGSALTLDGLGSLAGAIANDGSLTFANDHHAVTVATAITGLGSVTKNDSGTLTFTGNNSYAGPTTINDGTLRIADGGNINGDILNDAVLAIERVTDFLLGSDISGSGALTKAGPGALTLSGTNTYTGATTVTAGTLRIGGDSALGAAPASFVADQLTLGNGSTLHLLAGTTLAANRGLTTLGTVTISGSSLDVGTNLGGGGTINYAGGGTLTVGLGGNYTPHAFALTGIGQLTLDNLGQSQIFSSPLSGLSGSLARFQGAGSTSLQNTAPFAGNFQIAPGTTLRIGQGATGHGFLGASTNVLGTLELGRGDAVTYSGLSGDGVIIKDFAGTTTFAGSNSYRGSLVLRGGVLQMDNFNVTGAGPASFRADGLTFDGGTLRLTSAAFGGSAGANWGVTVTANHGVIDLPNGAAFVVGGAWGGPGTLTKTGTGDLLISGTGTIANSFRILDGWLVHHGEIGSPDTTFTGAISDDFLNLGTSGGFWVSHTLFDGDVTLTGTNTYNGGTRVSGGVDLILGHGGTTGTILGSVEAFAQSYLAYNRSGDFVLPNAVTGEGGLKQLGPGVLTINSAQVFTGALIAEQGTIRLTGGGSVLGGIVTHTNVLLDYAAATGVGNDISGPGAVSKAGAGTVTLTGNNTYSGSTNVSSGTLVLATANPGNGGASVTNGATLRFADGGSLGGTINLAGGTTLELDYSGNHTLAAGFAGSGTINKFGAGTAVLTAAPSFGGLIGLAAGTLEFAANADGEISGMISGAGHLTKSGTGTLTLTANNIFTGTTTINGGVLQLGNGGTDGRLSGPFVLNEGGTLAFNHSDVEFFGPVISGAGGIAQRGSGAFVLVADNTYTGGTAIAEGTTLQVGAGGTAGSIIGPVANDGFLVFDRSNGHTFAGNTTGSGVLRQSGTGVLTLTGQHSAAGGAVIDSGTTLALGTSATLTGPVENAGVLSILTAAGPDRELGVSIHGTGAVNIAGGGTLRIEGDVNYAGATTLSDNSTLKLVTPETSTLDNTLSGAGNLMKLGVGTLILTADSNLTGTVTIVQGTLQLGNGGSTGSIGGILNGPINLAGGTLAFNRSTVIDLFSPVTGIGGLSQLGSGRLFLRADNNFVGTTHVGNGSSLALGVGGSTGNVTGALSVDGTLQHIVLGNWTIQSGLTGFGTLQKFTAGQFNIFGEASAPVAFGGLIQYSGSGGPGSVQVGGTATLGSFSNIGTMSVTPGANLAVVGHTSVFTMTTTNQGTVTLGAGGASGYLGGTINGGTLAFNRSDVFAYTGNFINGTAVRQIGPGTTVFANDFGGTIEVAAGTLVLAGSTPYSGATVTGGTLQIGNGSFSGQVTGNIANAGTVAVNRTSTFNYGDVISGTGSFHQVAGTTVLTGANAYTGGTVISGGMLQVGSGGSLGSGGAHIAGGTLQFDTGSSLGAGTYTNDSSLVFNRNDSITVGNTLTGAGTLTKSGTGTVTLTAGNTYAGALNLTGGTLAVQQGTYTGGLTGGGQLTKSGAGTVTLAGSSTHTGTVNVADGTLLLGSAGALASGTAVTLADGTLLDFADHDVAIRGLTGGGAVDLGSGRLTIGQSGNFWGGISGTGGVTVAGGGFTLSGNNTYTGLTRVDGGTLSLASATALPGDLLIGNSAYLQLNTDLTFGAGNAIQAGANSSINVQFGYTGTFNAAIDGDGDLYKTGAGAMLVNAAPDLGGGTLFIRAGSLVLGSSAGAFNLAIDGGFLDVNGRDWSAPMTFERGGFANSAAGAVTISSALNVHNTLDLRSSGGGLRFTGTVTTAENDDPETEPVEREALYIRAEGPGRISLGDAPAAAAYGLSATGGPLVVEHASALTSINSLEIYSGGTIELGGGSATLALSNVYFGAWDYGSTTSLVNPVAGSTIRLETPNDEWGTIGYNGQYRDFDNGGTAILLGGAGNLELIGSAIGGADVAKVGTGRLLVDGNYANWSGRFDVREGTLAADLGFFATREVNLRAGGALDLLGAGDTVSFLGLTGDGTLDLGSRHFTASAGTNFGGSIVTTGSILFDQPGNSATLGHVSASQVLLTNGDLTITGPIAASTVLRVDSPTINAATLRVAASGVTTNDGATFTGTVDTNGRILLAGLTRNVATNAGSITLRNRDTESGTHTLLLSDDFNYGVVQSLTSNTGTLRLQNGYQVFTSEQTFTNTGTVAVTGSHAHPDFPAIQVRSHLAIGSGAGTVFNQTAGSLEVGAGAELAVRTLNVSGGIARLDGSVLAGGSGILNLTGGELRGTGSHSGQLIVAGGTFNPGASVGSFAAASATLASGQYRWEIADAAGAAGTGWDVLNLTGGVAVTATAANPFNFAVHSSGSVANFNPTNNYTWSVVAAPGGVTGFAADKFAVDGSGFAAATGNFGVAATGTGLQLVYNWSHAYDVAGTQTVTDALAANGDFGGLRKQGTGTLILASNPAYTGLTHVDGGTLQIGNGGTAGSVPGDIENQGTLIFNRSDATTYAGVISGEGSLTKQGSGLLILTGDHTYTGSTLVSQGTLFVNGSIEGSGLTVAAGALLGGFGDIDAPTVLATGGMLAPGTSPGTLTFSEGLALSAGSVVNFELGTVSDLIRVSGGVLSGPASGLVTLNFTDSGGFGPSPANTYLLFDFTGATLSSFSASGFTLGSTIAGYDYSFALTGSHLELTASAIPEPSTYAVALASVALIAASYRRRKLAVHFSRN